MHQSYFEKYLKPVVSPSTAEKTEGHSLLKMAAANDGHLPINVYTELHVNL